MSELEKKIISHLDQRIADAVAPYKTDMDRFREKVKECDGIIDAMVADPVVALRQGVSMSDIRKSLRDADIAAEDITIYEQVISAISKDMAQAREPLTKQKSRIIQLMEAVPHIAQIVLQYKVVNHPDTHKHERQLNANMDALIIELDNASVKVSDIKALKAQYLEVPELTLGETA